MKEKERIWLGKGVFPPGGWNKSQYRFLESHLDDGTRLRFDFWREIGHVTLPDVKKPFVVVASLNKEEKSAALIATVELPRKKEIDRGLRARIKESVKIALTKASYVPNIKID